MLYFVDVYRRKKVDQIYCGEKGKKKIEEKDENRESLGRLCERKK